MYAVVKFTDKKFKNFSDTVLLSWISEDQLFCSCPARTTELKLAVVNRMDPQPNWKLFGVKVKFISGERLFRNSNSV